MGRLMLQQIAQTDIYLIKKIHRCLIPSNTYFDATDLIKLMIEKNFKINYYNHSGTWKDLGRIEDFDKEKLKQKIK